MPAGIDRKNPEREGLPPGYRMRADAHYVDQLTSRRMEKPVTDAPRAAEKPAEASVRIDELLAHLSEGLTTIESVATLLSNDTSPIARRVNLDLIKTQAWRASWSLRAHAILQGIHRPLVRPRPLGFLLGQIRTGFAAECRLSGVGLQVHTSDWNAVVAVDESSLIAGLAAAVFSTLGLVEQAEGVTINVNAVASAGELRTVDITQDDVMVPTGTGAGFFDSPGADRSAMWPARLAASTAKAVARQHGGDASFLVTDRGGSTIRLHFSRAR